VGNGSAGAGPTSPVEGGVKGCADRATDFTTSRLGQIMLRGEGVGLEAARRGAGLAVDAILIGIIRMSVRLATVGPPFQCRASRIASRQRIHPRLGASDDASVPISAVRGTATEPLESTNADHRFPQARRRPMPHRRPCPWLEGCKKAVIWTVMKRRISRSGQR
jgi:hypothetical protein